jgi:glycosyltransferase involved in cell wall biosynthesis
VDCEDSDATSKRRTALSQVNDGYFCFLDDDTIFHENMYIKYLECKEENFKGMLVGEQVDKNGKLRLIASPPRYARIDTGNVLAHWECLKECSWPETFRAGINAKDFLFWESVYKYYNNKCGIWNQPISHYNKLR